MAKYEKDKTFENLPTCAAEYIRLVIKKMGYRKKARQEVQSELIDHFEEHLKGCAVAEEKEQKAKQLISEFGDAKLLAILMRRAKRRCRPLWRTVLVRTFQTIAAMIILLVLYVVWFLTGKPVISTDYIAQLNKIARPSADDSLNAAPLYQKAIDSLVDINDGKELLGKSFRDANDSQKQSIRQWLAKNESPLALVAKGAKLPYCWQRYESKDPEQSMMSVLLPNLVFSRQIAYALCWRAWLNAQTGDFNSAFQDIETCYRFGRHGKGDKTLIEQLVGMAIEGRALQTSRQILNTYKIESGALADFQQRLRQLIDVENFKPSWSVEKLCIYDEIQRCFTESRFGPSHVYPRHLVDLAVIKGVPSSGGWLQDLFLDAAGVYQNLPMFSRLLFTHPNKAKTLASVNAYYKFSDETFPKTPARLQAEAIDPNVEINRIIKNNLVLETLAPALSRIHMIAWRNKIDAESTVLIFALARFKQDTGSFPESLDKLVEQHYIEQVPIDPFSNGPLSYKKTEDGCMLYSWGENLKDDGGQIVRDKDGKVKRFAPEGDWVFWPVAEN